MSIHLLLVCCAACVSAANRSAKHRSQLTRPQRTTSAVLTGSTRSTTVCAGGWGGRAPGPARCALPALPYRLLRLLHSRCVLHMLTCSTLLCPLLCVEHSRLMITHTLQTCLLCVRVLLCGVCRAAAGPCDAEEYCSGDSESCPDDVFKHEGYVCKCVPRSPGPNKAARPSAFAGMRSSHVGGSGCEWDLASAVAMAAKLCEASMPGSSQPSATAAHQMPTAT